MGPIVSPTCWVCILICLSSCVPTFWLYDVGPWYALICLGRLCHAFLQVYKHGGSLQDEDFVIDKDDGGSPTDDSGEEESDASESGDEKEANHFYFRFIFEGLPLDFLQLLLLIK